jgi:hypothetical protein
MQGIKPHFYLRSLIEQVSTLDSHRRNHPPQLGTQIRAFTGELAAHPLPAKLLRAWLTPDCSLPDS